MKTVHICNTDKKNLSHLLVQLEIKLEQFPRKGQETIIAFPVYKMKKDLLIRNEGRNLYSIHSMK